MAHVTRDCSTGCAALRFLFLELCDGLALVSEGQWHCCYPESVSWEQDVTSRDICPRLPKEDCCVLGTKRDWFSVWPVPSPPFLFLLGRCLITRHGAQLWGRPLWHGEGRCGEALQQPKGQLERHPQGHLFQSYTICYQVGVLFLVELTDRCIPKGSG